MIDPTGKIVTDIRIFLAALPASNPWKEAGVWGGGIPAGKKPRCIAVVRLANTRERFHLGHYRYTIRVYGVESKSPLISAQDASVGSGLVSDALHQKGPSIRPTEAEGGVLTYLATEEIAGQPGRDPDTGWDYESSIFLVHAATQVVTA